MQTQITLRYDCGSRFTFTTPAPSPMEWEELELKDNDTDFEWEHYFVKGVESKRGDDSVSLIVENSLDESTMTFPLPLSGKKALAYLAHCMPDIYVSNAQVLDVKLFVRK